MIIQEHQLKNYPYKSKKGLSESLAKKHFSKQGFEVYRGQRILGPFRSINYDFFENVRRVYDRVEFLLKSRVSDELDFFREGLRSGIPDYLIYRKIDDNLKFVEVKMEHEQIKENQLDCMKYLESFGFEVVVFRVKQRPFRLRSELELENENKLQNRQIEVKQTKLKLRY